MNVEEVKAKIATANATSENLNKERQINIGKKESYTAQLEKAFVDYESAYGVKLTKENITQELERVKAEKEKELALVEGMIACIQMGDYNGARQMAGEAPVESVEEPTVNAEVLTPPTETVPTPVENIMPAPIENAPLVEEPKPAKKRGRPKKTADTNTTTEVETESTPVAPVVESAPVPPVAPTVPTPTVSAPVPPVAPTVPTPTVSAPVPPVAPTVPTVESTPVAPTVPTPTVSAPVPPVAPTVPTPAVSAPVPPVPPVAPTVPTAPTPVVSAPVPPVAPTVPTPTVSAPVPPVAPTPVENANAELMNGALAGFQGPQGSPTTFQDILGAPFNGQ